jgi:hypothetical protein
MDGNIAVAKCPICLVTLFVQIRQWLTAGIPVEAAADSTGNDRVLLLCVGCRSIVEIADGRAEIVMLGGDVRINDH